LSPGRGAVLVTGGAGFIGSHLVERLLRDGQRVIALDNFDPFYDPAIKRRNLQAASAHPSFRFVEGDIRDGALLDRLFREEPIASVVHLAARAGVRPSMEDPEGYADVNVRGTVSVFEACRRNGVRRVLFGSSSSVYGNNSKVPFAESDPVDEPVSPYAATKRAGELVARVYHHLFGFEVACLRLFTVYGPRQRPEMAIHKFARLLARGAEIEQYGDGSSARDYTYVSDIVEGIVRALDRCRSYHIWNLGGSHATPLRELVERIAAGLGVPARVRVLPPQPGDVERTWADIRRAREELGWQPRVRLEEGLALFLDWFRRQGGAGSP
jgi:UDP-glucuronate 4-epimerase